MSSKEGTTDHFNKLMPLCMEYCNCVRTLYQLKTANDEEIHKIHKMIKDKMIDTKILTPERVILIISQVIIYNNRFFPSYWKLFKLIYEEYHPKHIKKITAIFDYFVYKEYVFVFDAKNKEKIKNYNYSMNVHEENPIWRAIMNDDNESFIGFIENKSFDINETISSKFFPEEFVYSYIDLCCYYGAVNCFKLLITKFNSPITESCLKLSFLGGNPEIMSECLKKIKIYQDFMEFAMISHNIDFITFLMNERSLKI
ncbi:hypothetical protein TVAG_130960 [Trichomonas vaginalis G3]|uniref:DUF3447 domain-containing protein n=1 Tax=Trichomonas vaginalis (strain ATCC PRA-98 / G3) TaxID=412133 RepID=A2EPL9_TRIV3|nr:protein of unknown function (DUF3447) [Trichomonas vaginalis G3]EAY05362.1 hypothetical protein TVAG_130960 [Trichomonas vaginalis G3]KAI5524045.1 protein of unknown function (DUF3447) [Trichomonas vaginalis G3]|eukprot:XP_001317585.1 hypothetical protein [Trichomonas vaginalis G3]